MTALSAHHITCRIGTRTILHDVNVTATDGDFVAVVGPNGSGKSTLLRCLAGLLPHSGEVKLSQKRSFELSRRELARTLAMVAQQSTPPEEHRVRDVIALGRIPHLHAFTGLSAKDHRIVAAAADEVSVTHLLDRRFGTCSGGEQQRVHIARALAQECSILLLDEPTNHLDVKHQFAILELASSLPVTTVAVLHDLNLAAQFADHILLLDSGRVAASGSPAEVLTPEAIEVAFGLRPQVTGHKSHVDIRFHRVGGGN